MRRSRSHGGRGRRIAQMRVNTKAPTRRTRRHASSLEIRRRETAARPATHLVAVAPHAILSPQYDHSVDTKAHVISIVRYIHSLRSAFVLRPTRASSRPTRALSSGVSRARNQPRAAPPPHRPSHLTASSPVSSPWPTVTTPPKACSPVSACAYRSRARLRRDASCVIYDRIISRSLRFRAFADARAARSLARAGRW